MSLSLQQVSLSLRYESLTLRHVSFSLRYASLSLRYVSFDYDVSLSICSVTLLLRYAINRKWRKLTRFPDL